MLGGNRGYEGLEFLLLEERQQLVRVGLALAEILELQCHRHVDLERHELPGNARKLGLFDQLLAALWLLDLVRLREKRFQIAVLIDQFGGSLDADALDARHVIGAVAGQRLHLDHLVGADAELLDHVFGADGLVLHAVPQRDAVADELHQVLVRRDDGDVHALLGGLGRVGGDQVVGLVVLHLHGGDVHRLGRLADQRELRDQVLGRIGAVCLVVGIDVIAERLARLVENHRDVVGLGVLDKLQQHTGIDVGGVGGRAVRARHLRAAAAHPGEVGPEDEPGSVDQE